MLESFTKLLKPDPIDYKPINSEPDNIETKLDSLIYWTDKTSSREKENICFDLHTKIKACNYCQEKIKLLIENYSDDILFETIKLYIGESHIRYNILFLVPKNAKHLIFILIKGMIPIGSIEAVSEKININFIGDNNETCLFRITDADYLINILASNKLKFDLNHTNKNKRTFFTEIFTKKMNMTVKQSKMLIDILIKLKYDFNQIHIDVSLLDIICLSNITNINLIKNIIIIPDLDITMTTLWLYTLIHSYPLNYLRSLLSFIISRSDYKSFLNKIINSYFYATVDADILLIMNLVWLLNNEKLIKMITYKNSDENTVLHIASMYRLKKVIRFIKLMPNLIFEKNTNGKTPYDLYVNSSIDNILQC